MSADDWTLGNMCPDCGCFECECEPEEPDFRVQNEGSIFLLHPMTPAAEQWIEEHIPEDAQRFGGAVVVEHRYICDIIDGVRDDGLTVERG